MNGICVHESRDGGEPVGVNSESNGTSELDGRGLVSASCSFLPFRGNVVKLSPFCFFGRYRLYYSYNHCHQKYESCIGVAESENELALSNVAAEGIACCCWRWWFKHCDAPMFSASNTAIQ
jgi:hypothetical protein